MTFAIHEGVWPVMITPWKEDNTPDFKALEALTNWYVEKGCDGIFAVCQSSEMHYLSAQEKLDIARCVSEAAAGRLQIVASGNTECSRTEHSEKQCRGKRSREKRHRGRQRGKEHSSAVRLISERRWD